MTDGESGRLVGPVSGQCRTQIVRAALVLTQFEHIYRS
jgi:hypothetical protein